MAAGQRLNKAAALLGVDAVVLGGALEVGMDDEGLVETVAGMLRDGLAGRGMALEGCQVRGTAEGNLLMELALVDEQAAEGGALRARGGLLVVWHDSKAALRVQGRVRALAGGDRAQEGRVRGGLEVAAGRKWRYLDEEVSWQVMVLVHRARVEQWLEDVVELAEHWEEGRYGELAAVLDGEAGRMGSALRAERGRATLRRSSPAVAWQMVVALGDHLREAVRLSANPATVGVLAGEWQGTVAELFSCAARLEEQGSAVAVGR